MKRFTIAIALILSSLMSFSQTKDSEGHILVNLWKTYYKAEKADKPQDQAKALEAIKEEAIAKHLAWDFYDAAERYVNVKSSINWKDRTQLQTAMENEIETMGEPVAVFFLRHTEWGSKAAAYVEKHKETLQASFNPEFYSRDRSVVGQLFSEALLPLIKNDYEYTLWSMYLRRETCPLTTYYNDSYPFAAFAEFFSINHWKSIDNYESWGAYAEKYKDKAVSLMARQRRLSYEMSDLKNAKNSTSEDFKALRAKCVKFESDRKSYTGQEKQIADCCTYVESIISELDSKEIDSSIHNNLLTLELRNVSSLKFRIDDVYSTEITNKSSSYYVKDTVKLQLPDIDDGYYTYYCTTRGCEHKQNYDKHTLSMSMRADSRGYGAYVADYISGKPIEVCDFYIYDADKHLLSEVKGVKMDGYTPLPEEFDKYFTDKYKSYYFRAGFKDGGRQRWTNYMGINSPNPGAVRPVENTNSPNAVLITDRGAYNPGETVQFKAVLYSGTYEYKLSPEGKEVEAALLDTNRDEVATMKLITNEFGSVAGSFPLESVTRGGMYTVRVRSNGYTLASREIRVDEFVLPTFDLTWDKDDNLYLPGDKVNVSGRVKAYSGHSLAGAKLFYSVRGTDPSIEEQELDVKPDGSFAFSFISTKKYGNTYPVTVKIVDATGETLSFNTWCTVHGSLPLSVTLKNTVPGKYSLASAGSSYNWRSSSWIIRDSFARLRFSTGELVRKGLEIRYKVLFDGSKVVASGTAGSQETIDVSLEGQPSGLYVLEVLATANDSKGTQYKNETKYSFVKAGDDDTALNMHVKSFFKELSGDEIALQIGATEGPIWAVVELFGTGNVLLEHQIVALDGKFGKSGSLHTIRYERKPEYPETLTLHVLFFRDGESFEYTRTLKLPFLIKDLPLSFGRFVDTARPGEECHFIINTDPGIECAAAIFDKATETIHHNNWSRIYPARKPEATVSFNTVCGFNGNQYIYTFVEDRMAGKAAGGRVLMRSDKMVMEEAVPMAVEEASDYVADNNGANMEPEPEVQVRENLAATMAWEPYLRSNKDGVIDFVCKGSDRLSTYYVQLFAHGEGMQNAVLRQEMQVTIPVKVSIVEPQFLYAGDRYTAAATVANNLKTAVKGRAAIRFYDGKDYKTARVLGTRQAVLDIPAGSALPFSADFEVPSGVTELGIMVNFVSDNTAHGSDAMFVSVPVEVPLQTLTEAHSAVLLSGADKDALIAELRGMFINIDGSALEPEVRSIIDMIREAIPDKVEPKGTNVLCLTEAYYSNILARRLGAPGLDDAALKEIVDKIAACQNLGGGIAWFEGMEASPIITATVLQRIAAMPDADLSAIDTEAAVNYLDDEYFGTKDRPWWCGGISLSVYLQTRALYPQVPFKSRSGKLFREFKKDVKGYLVPRSERGMNGQILAKARRLRTLQSLAQLPGGDALAKAWGVKLRKKILKSLDADVESLLQYAVAHRSGGCYYPNAVMPWRGLMESELYAHSLLCDLFTSACEGNPQASWAQPARDTAEGIRLWLMIQKETQQWDTDPAYIESIASVLRGTPQTLETKVVLLKGTFTKPFPEVKASGNGFTVSREYTVGGRQLNDGDSVRVGDRVIATYKIWSEENRSFVRLTAPRPASMRPVRQLSGHYGWWLSPLSVGGWRFSPQGYRNVCADKTEYWFDSYPEENTSISEEFFVTQEGAFQLPAIEIESLYAPHYRANGDGRGALISGK
ncbi:MAG: hypothetical protein IKX67_03690 [Bacteroidales bacterium]|nr:hypothetical protein [Bacteroidales bacterium]